MGRGPEFDIYVVADTSGDYGRRLLRGVVGYAAARHEPWRIGWGEFPAAPLHRTARGFIALVRTAAEARRLKRSGLPAVNYSTRLPATGLPSVVPDNAAIGRLAATFFRERLYTRFGFVGTAAHHYSVEREAAFRAALAEADIQCCEGVGRAGPAPFIHFLHGLPAGTAVFAANDFFARQVVRYAAEAGRAVPDELAVLGVDAEELISMSAGVSISSIDPAFDRIGFEAARLLDRLMADGEPPRDPLRVTPAGIVERESTGHYGGGDALVASAMAVVRERACSGLHVRELARLLGVSRRTLEVRFRAAGAPGMDAVIRTERLRRARDMLRGTSLTVAEVGERCGFNDVFYFSTAFKRATGMSPRAYRNAHRPV